MPKATMRWTISSTAPRQSSPRSNPKQRESLLLWTTMYQALEPTVPIRPLHLWRGPSCREFSLSLYYRACFGCFKNVGSDNFSRRRYFPAISAPPVIIPKDPPLPGPGQYDVGDYKGPSRKAMPTAAFASKTERLPLNSQADTGPGPGKGLLGCYSCEYVKDFRKHFFPALHKTNSRLFNL